MLTSHATPTEFAVAGAIFWIAFHFGPPENWVVPFTIHLRPVPVTMVTGYADARLGIVAWRAVKAVRADGVCLAALTHSAAAVLLAVAATGWSIARCFVYALCPEVVGHVITVWEAERRDAAEPKRQHEYAAHGHAEKCHPQNDGASS